MGLKDTDTHKEDERQFFSQAGSELFHSLRGVSWDLINLSIRPL